MKIFRANGNGHERGPASSKRREIKKLASRAIRTARSYVLVMWNGDPTEAPICIIDVEGIHGKDSLQAKAMGKIGQHAAACTNMCKDLIGMSAAEQEQALRAKAFKAARSASLAAEANNETDTEPKEKEPGDGE